MTWEPDEKAKAKSGATSTSLPTIKSFSEAVGLDDMGWEKEAPTLGNNTNPGKEPLAVG